MKTFTKTHKELIRRRADLLAGWLAALPDCDWKNPKPYHQAVADLLKAVLDWQEDRQ